MLFGTVAASAPYVAAILLLVIFCWGYAVRSLGKQFASMIGDRGREEIGEGNVEPADAQQLSKDVEGTSNLKPTFITS
jgi:AAA family ATP:ADP antiporter